MLSDIDRTDTRAIRRNHGRTIMGNQVQAECASGCTPLAITARCIGGQAIVGGPRSWAWRYVVIQTRLARLAICTFRAGYTALTTCGEL